jgi:hypothetical protein
MAMELLLVLGGMIFTLGFSAISCARSYLEVGRQRGFEEAIQEIGRGARSHCEAAGKDLSETVEKAVLAVKAAPMKRRPIVGSAFDPRHAELWKFGDQIGEASWRKGHGAGVRRKAPAEGKIRVDLSVNELLQLSWLAHLGFQHMMPNYRGFEVYRFSGEEDAAEGAVAIGKIEASIPFEQRPIADLTIQFKNRRELIEDWWQKAPAQSIA